MRKVGDWELARAQPYFSRDWTFAALYAGYMAAAKALPEPRYEAAMLDMGNHFDWTPGPRKAHADDQAIAQTYLGSLSRLPRAAHDRSHSKNSSMR